MPFLIVIIVAVLAIGGGAYVVTKNKEAKVETETESSVETETGASLSGDLNAQGSLRSLLALGRDTMCTFESTEGGTSSAGTVYISSDGSMRGDFTSETSTGAQASSMIVKGGTSYVWSGSQGAKMDVSETSTSASTESKSNVDLDSQVDYRCSSWTRDESKFTVPSSVNFLDVKTMMRGWDGTIKGQAQ